MKIEKIVFSAEHNLAPTWRVEVPIPPTIEAEHAYKELCSNPGVAFLKDLGVKVGSFDDKNVKDVGGKTIFALYFTTGSVKQELDDHIIHDSLESISQHYAAELAAKFKR